MTKTTHTTTTAAAAANAAIQAAEEAIRAAREAMDVARDAIAACPRGETWLILDDSAEITSDPARADEAKAAEIDVWDAASDDARDVLREWLAAGVE